MCSVCVGVWGWGREGSVCVGVWGRGREGSVCVRCVVAGSDMPRAKSNVSIIKLITHAVCKIRKSHSDPCTAIISLNEVLH